LCFHIRGIRIEFFINIPSVFVRLNDYFALFVLTVKLAAAAYLGSAAPASDKKGFPQGEASAECCARLRGVKGKF